MRLERLGDIEVEVAFISEVHETLSCDYGVRYLVPLDFLVVVRVKE